MIDEDDAEIVSGLRWNLTNKGYVCRSEHIPGEPRNRKILLHRMLLGLTGSEFVGDHVNRNRLDNRRSNLRIVTQALNNQNVDSRNGSRSRYRGVGWHASRNRWRAYVTLNRRFHHAGLFDSEIEAARAAQALRIKLLPNTVEEII